jgi:hypothetical protein
VPLATAVFALDKIIKLYPNPTKDSFQINLGDTLLENDVQNISIVDVKGSLVQKNDKFKEVFDIKKLSKGTYFVKIQFSNTQVTKKLIVQ